MKPHSRVTRREEFDDSLRKYAQQSSASAGSTVPEVPKVGAPVGAAAEVQPKKITIAPAPINQIPKAPKPPQMPIGTTASPNVDLGAPKSPKSSTTAQDLRLSMLRLMFMEKLFKSYKTLAWKRAEGQIAKASSEPSGSQPEQWIAPGGEHLRGEKARRFFLKHSYGDAAYAARKHQRAIDEHNALYLADKQPKGMLGTFPVPKEKQDGLPPTINWNHIDGETEGEPVEIDPTHAVSAFNQKRDARLWEGETQKQANERVGDSLWQSVKESLAAHTDPFTISADPNNPRQWKYHGLQNSFANHDAFDNIPLHEFYNQLSKAYKTPAWQREAGQNPKGGLNAKGRASARAEGHNLKPPVKSGDNPRRASFLARMGNSPGPEHDEHGKPTRLLLALQAWGASSKADARKKAKAISKRLQRKKVEKALVFRTSGYDDLLKGRGAEARSNPSSYSVEEGHSIHDPSMLRLKAAHDSLEKFSSLVENRPPKPFFGRFINAGENVHMGYFGPQGMISLTTSPTDHTDPESPTKMKTKDVLTPGAPVAHPKILYLRIAHDAPEPVTEKHEQEIFHALWDAGYRGRNMTYAVYPDVDSTASKYAHLRAARGQPPRPITAQRDRLFGLRKKRWASFVDGKNSEQNSPDTESEEK